MAHFVTDSALSKFRPSILFFQDSSHIICRYQTEGTFTFTRMRPCFRFSGLMSRTQANTYASIQWRVPAPGLLGKGSNDTSPCYRCLSASTDTPLLAVVHILYFSAYLRCGTKLLAKPRRTTPWVTGRTCWTYLNHVKSRLERLMSDTMNEWCRKYSSSTVQVLKILPPPRV